ncbi:MAG TPA: hypothetical protein VHV09_07080 [Trebonia sp.]|nr:hypothetical protein [Trebonia sp.]
MGEVTSDDTLMVIIAEDDGDTFCLADADGSPATYAVGDPEIEERIREARDVYGAVARAITLEEFKALPDDD